MDFRRSSVDRMCESRRENCHRTISAGQLYAHIIVWPTDDNDMLVGNECMRHIDDDWIRAAILRMKRKQEKKEQQERQKYHTDREHVSNILHFGACDDDAHDANI